MASHELYVKVSVGAEKRVDSRLAFERIRDIDIVWVLLFSHGID